jgi:ligand-binding sensor domain-containing protein
MIIKSGKDRSTCLPFVIGMVLLILLSSEPALSQCVNLKNYSVDDVLPSSKVYMAFQDSRGFVWFGTDLGASRFDGNSFTHFNTKDGLSDNEVFNFFEDSHGRIWFQTMNGKVSYYQDGDIVNSSVDTTLRPLDSDSYIAAMSEDARGSIWITSHQDGVIRYDKGQKIKRFFNRREFGRLYNVFFVGDTKIVLCSAKGLFQISFDADFQEVLQIEDLKAGVSMEDHFPKYMRLNEDEFIMKTDYAVGWYRKNNQTSGTIMSTRKEDQVYSLSKDEDFLWVGTGRGVLQYGHDKTFKQVILSNHLVTSVLKDWEGNYWFTTLGEGVYFCTSLDMLCYTKKNGLLADRVACLAKDSKNRPWLGYAQGADNDASGAVSYIEGNVIKHFQLLDGKVFDRMSTQKIRFNEKHGWIATNYGVLIIDGKKVDILHTYTRDVFELPNDSIWVGSGGVIFALSRKQFNKQSEPASTFRIDPAKDYRVNTRRLNKERDRVKAFFLDSKNKLWIAAEKKMYSFIKDSLNVIEYSQLDIPTYVNDFEELADHTLVLSTNGGGLVFVKDGRNILTLTENQGLSSSMCTAVMVDKDGVIWVATNKGINKIAGYPDHLSISYLSTNDGLLSNDVTDVLAVEDTVWVATSKGINLFHKDIAKKVVPPRIYIDYISVRGEPVKVNHQQRLDFTHKENDLSIMYTGLSYNNGEQIIYRYKLHPDDAWRFTKSTSVYLPELPPDDYQFIVSAKGRSGQWSEEAVLAFVINKPLWKTIGFMVSCSILLLGVLWITLAVYFGQQKKEIRRQHQVTLSELKTLRAQMNPHFLFNALNAIQGILLKNNLATTQDYLSRFGKLMRTILDHSDKATISIAEELESITNYLEIEVMRTNYQFSYTIDIAPVLDIHNTEIPAMMLQPFIENSIWHGFNQKNENNCLLIKFTLETPDNVVITIEDNGIGREKAMALRTKTHRSKGIHLVQERIDILNFRNPRKIILKINDLKNQTGNAGTQVMLVIPAI